MMNKSPLVEGFWERFDDVCYEDNINRTEIARRIGCNRKTFYRSGHEGMRMVYLAKFYAINGTSADWLLGLSKERKLK